MCPLATFSFFFFNDTATTEIYTLSLHDALPIYAHGDGRRLAGTGAVYGVDSGFRGFGADQHPASRVAAFGKQSDRKSTRLNSSHLGISYAVFCLKKKQSPG